MRIMDKESVLYYQSNIKTSRNEDSVYAMKYASQQMLIDKLEQQCKKQKEVIDKMNKLLQQEQDAMTTKFHYDIVGLINALLDILKEVSE